MRLHAVCKLAALFVATTAVVAENGPTEQHAAHMTGKEMRMMDGDEEISMEDYGEETERVSTAYISGPALRSPIPA